MKNLFRKLVLYCQKKPRLDFLALLVALKIFGLICFFNLTRASIWFDEGFSAYMTNFDFAKIAELTAHDIHPPLYYWFLKIWSSLFGASEIGFRSLSVVFGMLTILTLFVLARRFFGRKVALTTLPFLALSPMLIRYSSEARMYTLAALIVALATYFLIKASSTQKWRDWLFYALLMALGMWTHYFTALVWLAQAIWLAIQKITKANQAKQKWYKQLFTKKIITTYLLAIGLYLPWLFVMIGQLGKVQATGFWIRPASVTTLPDYLTNFFYYLDSDQTTGWLALLFWIIFGLIIWLSLKAVKMMPKKQRPQFWLIIASAILPVILLFLASLPPLRPSFMDRYLVPSIALSSLFLGLVLITATQKWRPAGRIVLISVVTGMMILGINRVYFYGNYNKTTGISILARQVVEQIDKVAVDGEPIIANSPWMFYELAPYSSHNHPIYFIDEATEYNFGSLKMLQDSDMHKIKNLSHFLEQNPRFWYVGGLGRHDEISAYKSSWRAQKTLRIKDTVTGKKTYGATLYEVQL